MRPYLCIIALLFSYPAAAAESFINIQKVTSPSGITAWLVEDHSVPVIAMQFSFRDAGAKNDPVNKQGLARLASNTMDEGAGQLTSQEFQKRLDDLSITLRFNTSRDHFGGNLKTLSRNKDEAFSLLEMALTTPRFDEEPVARMRAANQSRIKSSIANPKWIAARLQNDKIFEGHAYALNTGGTLSSLESITPDDLRGFHKTLGKNQLVIAVSGDISSDDLKLLLDKTFGQLPNTPEQEHTQYNLKNAGTTYLYEMDIPQTIIEISQNGVRRTDEDYYAAKVMNFILGESGFGSRLMEEIREKRGLTYGIYSYFQEYEDTDTLQISTSTVNESVSELLSLVREEWTKMIATPVEDQELDEAKSYLIGSLPLSLTSTDAIASIILSLQLEHLPKDYLDSYKDKISAITKEEIQSAAKRILDKDSFTTILVGKPQNIQAEKITTLPNVE